MEWYLYLIIWGLLMNFTVIGMLYLSKSSHIKNYKHKTWHYLFAWIIGLIMFWIVPILATILIPKHVYKYFKKWYNKR